MIKKISIIALSLLLVSTTASFAQWRSRSVKQQQQQQAQQQVASDKNKSDKAKSSAKKGREAAPSNSTADDRTAVEVTVYNHDLGLVKESRSVVVAAGEGELRFIDVPSLINPVTVHIKPLGGADFTVLEQNYEYDLISHAKLMDKYVGKKIKIAEWNEYHDRKNVVEADVMSVASGEVYKIENEIYLGHPGVKILPEIPGNLISRPTLSWLYKSKSGGEKRLEVSYMTGGMNWNADYILAVGQGDGGADLSGWVTVNNHSGAEFEDAKLKLVAGEVNRVRPQADMFAGRGSQTRMMMEMAAPAPAFEQSEVFEYYIYDLQRPTTLKNNQTKQISLMEAQGVTVAKEYTTTSDGISFRGIDREAGQPAKQPVTAFFSFRNSKENKLGDPLPAGTVRLYTEDAAGRRQFIGEDRIAHTPKDEEVRLKAGEAFDIVAERSQTDFKQITSQKTEAEWTVTIRNRKEEDVTVGVIERAYGTWEIAEASHKYKKIDANTFRFDVAVGKGQEVVVKYKIMTGI